MGKLVVLGLALVGCQKVVYGSGTLFVWNGTDRTAQVDVDGRTSESLTLSRHTGERVEAVAGRYRVREAGAGPRYELEVKDGNTVVVNLDSGSCFARSDIAGMYRPGKERVRVLQTYEREDVLAFEQELPVLPGEPPPLSSPRNALVFQRLSEVPCNLLRDEAAIADWVRRAR